MLGLCALGGGVLAAVVAEAVSVVTMVGRCAWRRQWGIGEIRRCWRARLPAEWCLSLLVALQMLFSTLIFYVSYSLFSFTPSCLVSTPCAFHPPTPGDELPLREHRQGHNRGFPTVSGDRVIFWKHYQQHAQQQQDQASAQVG